MAHKILSTPTGNAILMLCILVSFLNLPVVDREAMKNSKIFTQQWREKEFFSEYFMVQKYFHDKFFLFYSHQQDTASNPT
jgi:hypothetical protein